MGEVTFNYNSLPILPFHLYVSHLGFPTKKVNNSHKRFSKALKFSFSINNLSLSSEKKRSRGNLTGGIDEKVDTQGR